MSPANNRLNMTMLDKDFIRNNVTLYIMTIPAGAGGAFLGYLQQLYVGHDKDNAIVEPIDIKDFPHNNHWDSIGVGYEYKDMPLIPDWEPGFEELFINYKGKDKQDIINNDINRLTNRINSAVSERIQQFGVESAYNFFMPCHIFPHDFAIDLRLMFKYVEHTLAVTGDLDTIKYASQLKSAKSPLWMERNKNKIKDKAEDVYKNIQLASPLTNIDYKKIFIDIDKDEIKKFLTSTIDIKEFNNDKLETICEMIKTYTQVNKELIA